MFVFWGPWGLGRGSSCLVFVWDRFLLWTAPFQPMLWSVSTTCLTVPSIFTDTSLPQDIPGDIYFYSTIFGISLRRSGRLIRCFHARFFLFHLLRCLSSIFVIFRSRRSCRRTSCWCLWLLCWAHFLLIIRLFSILRLHLCPRWCLRRLFTLWNLRIIFLRKLVKYSDRWIRGVCTQGRKVRIFSIVIYCDRDPQHMHLFHGFSSILFA